MGLSSIAGWGIESLGRERWLVGKTNSDLNLTIGKQGIVCTATAPQIARVTRHEAHNPGMRFVIEGD